MSIPFVPRERATSDWPTESVARPGAYPRPRDVEFVDTKGGRAVRYLMSLQDRDLWIDPLVEMDVRARRAVEAFTALPLTSRGVAGPIPDEARLRDFVLTFGPVNTMAADLRTLDMQWVRLPDGNNVPARLQEGLEGIGAQVEDLRSAIETADALALHDVRGLHRTHPKPGHLDERSRWVVEGVEEYARRMLAELITAKTGALREITVVDPRGRFGATRRSQSLLDLMYWQLRQQLQRRPRGQTTEPDPVFRMPWCGVCGGAIFSTRLAEDRANRWHAGCKAAGKAKRRRDRRAGKENSQ